MVKIVNLLSIVCLLLLSTMVYADGNVGNIVRDVQGAPYAIFKCTSALPILKWDTTLTPPRFKCSADAGATGVYTTIQEEGVNLAAEAKLNFIGSSITCVDDAGNSRTNCTVTDATGYDTVQEEGSSLTARSTINFVGSTVTCADSGGKTVCTFTSSADGVGYDEVLDEGSGLTKRAKLNFIGGGVSCADNSGSTRTDCTFTDLSTLAFVTIGNTGSLSSERALTAGTGITITDGGADSTVTVGLTDQPAGCDKFTCTEIMEYFVGQRGQLAGTSTTAGSRVFNYGWDYTSANTGGIGTIPGAVALANDARGNGISLQTGSSAAGGICMGIGYRPFTFTEDSGEGPIVLETAFYIEDLSNSSHRYEFAVGLGDYTTGNACAATSLGMTNYERLYYTDNVNSGKFQCQWKGSGTSTADSGVTVAADTWYTMKIAVNSDHSQVDIYLATGTPHAAYGSAVCSYNGVDLADGAGETPSIGFTKTVGTSGDRQVYFNFMYARQDLTTAR